MMGEKGHFTFSVLQGQIAQIVLSPTLEYKRGHTMILYHINVRQKAWVILDLSVTSQTESVTIVMSE